MKKILLSLLSIGVVAVVAVVATRAFFSDTETSTGNSFVAGALDLKVDSEQHYDGMVCVDGIWKDEDLDLSNNPRPDLVGKPCDGTWPLADLTKEKFFNFTDVKPGDYGENTISLHVDDNPAWLCADITNLHDDDNSITEPEKKDGDTDTAPGLGTGDLSPELHFFAWADNGAHENGCDNVWEEGELPLFSNIEGPASDVLGNKTYALADSTHGGVPFPGGQTSCIGLQWCYGKMSVDQHTHIITCDGALVNNKSQTDSLTADLAFRVEQYRNNQNFFCQAQ